VDRKRTAADWYKRVAAIQALAEPLLPALADHPQLATYAQPGA
jgi:hypothetical protein